MAFQIKQARREMARARIGLCGPSGSGKTMGGLRLARGMAEALLEAGAIRSLEGAIGCIDTERKSASLYADVVPFVTIELEPPYSPARYAEALEALEQHGCAIVLLDQISHAWAGPGGLLEYVDTLKAQSRNAISPWTKATPEQNRFVDRMLRSDAHIIATMRSKAEWVIEEQVVDGRRKQVPRKIGLSPVQREGIEYEFTTVLDLDIVGNTATASKDRTRLFAGQCLRLDEAWGRTLVRWLLAGEPPRPAALEPAAPAPAPASAAPAPLPPQTPPSAGFIDEPVGREEQRAIWTAARNRALALNLHEAAAVERIVREALRQVGREATSAVRWSEFELALAAIEACALLAAEPANGAAA